MLPAKPKLPNYEQIISDLLRPATGPVPVAALTAQMLAIRPSAAKDPQKGTRQHVVAAVGRQLVFLDPDTVLPLRLAYQGARFRLPLDAETVRRGRLPIDHSLTAYLPNDFDLAQLQFVDAAGRPIVFRLETVSEQVASPFGRTTVKTRYADLAAWFKAERVGRDDALLFTVADWEQGVFQLAVEPLSRYDPARHQARTQLLAEMFYDLLEGASDESIYSNDAVPTVYARLPDKAGYPPDHWMIALAVDGRLTSDGWRIHYSDSGFSMLEQMVREVAFEPADGPPPISKEQSAQVYRFKAVLVHRPSLWRTLEIQGQHTLADLDRALRRAFRHDDSDHLAGFSKLIRRGGLVKTGAAERGPRTRYREVDLGTVDPMGEGDGAEVQIATLGLSAGDQLKYLYDFGSTVEHRLTLEAITAPAERVKYPREVGRNQPKPINCVDCEAKGKQTVATMLCLDCSNRRNKEVTVCEACAAQRHQDHYLEDIVY